jgi:hypothetical protein
VVDRSTRTPRWAHRAIETAPFRSVILRCATSPEPPPVRTDVPSTVSETPPAFPSVRRTSCRARTCRTPRSNVPLRTVLPSETARTQHGDENDRPIDRLAGRSGVEVGGGVVRAGVEGAALEGGTGRGSTPDPRRFEAAIAAIATTEVATRDRAGHRRCAGQTEDPGRFRIEVGSCSR